MSRRLRVTLVVVVALAALGVLGVAALMFQDLRTIVANLADPQTLIEQVVDEYLAANPREVELRADDPLLKNRTILVTANINEDTAKQVAARLLYLNAVDPHRPIDLYLSTQGGWIDSAFTILREDAFAFPALGVPSHRHGIRHGASSVCDRRFHPVTTDVPGLPTLCGSPTGQTGCHS
jgi:hypothetical protein